MKSLFSLFRRESNESSAAQEIWQKGHRAYERGRVHIMARSDQEALDCFDEAIRCGFESADVFALRGTCLQSLSWELDAIEDFTKAISLEPEDCNFHFQRAMVRSSVGDTVGFEADLQEAIRLSRIENTSNFNHNAGARQMGWPNAAAMFQAHAVQAKIPDALAERYRERAELRGRRPTSPNVA